MAVDLNGTDEYMDYAGTPVNETGITLAAWVYPNVSQNQSIGGLQRSDNSRKVILYLDGSGNLRLQIQGTTTITHDSAQTVTNNQWNLVIGRFTVNGANLELSGSVNGAAFSTPTSAATPTGMGTTQWAWGRRVGTVPDWYFDGGMCEIVGDNAAWTDANASSWWNSGSGQPLSDVGITPTWHALVEDNTTPETPSVGTGDLTKTGAPPDFTHPFVNSSASAHRKVSYHIIGSKVGSALVS